jgi:hypothetical protein
VAVGAAANANSERAFDPLPGTWWIQIDIPGEPSIPYLTYMQQFTRDGRSSIFLGSALPEGGGGFTETRSGCVGDWRRAGPHQYDLTLYCLCSDQKPGKVPDRIRAIMTVDKKGQHFSAPFVYEVWDGTQCLYGDMPLQMTGTRMDIVPYRP